MKKFLLHSLVAVLGMGVFSGMGTAQAGTVISESGATVITIGGKRDRLSGQYTTRANGVTWEGSFDANARSQGSYVGTFEDRPSTEPINRPQIFCTGEVRLQVTERGRFDPTGMTLTWRPTGGQRCPSIGQTFTVTLKESLPRPDLNGNYTDANARTYVSQDRKLIWPEWEVVSPDGKLNCRATPYGAVTFTFRSGEKLNRMTAFRDSHFQLDDRGGSWLWVSSKQCYVRAGATTIAPLSDTPWD